MENKLELGAQKGKDRDFIVKKPFYLKTRNGPLEIAESDSIVTLTKETALQLLHCGYVIPVGIPKESEYEVLSPFTYVSGGEYSLASCGTVMIINCEDALKLMLDGKIRPLDEKAFYPREWER